jgi:hypothetical protein
MKVGPAAIQIPWPKPRTVLPPMKAAMLGATSSMIEATITKQHPTKLGF